MEWTGSALLGSVDGMGWDGVRATRNTDRHSLLLLEAAAWVEAIARKGGLVRATSLYGHQVMAGRRDGEAAERDTMLRAPLCPWNIESRRVLPSCFCDTKTILSRRLGGTALDGRL